MERLMNTKVDYLLEMKNISKNFGAVQALKGVNLSIKRGEILGLVGDNAAGKSTLMKILTGIHRADQGTIFLNNRKVDIKNPHDSRKLGIEMIYQDFGLAPNLNIVDNIFLGREIRKSLFFIKILDRRKEEQLARKALNKTNIRIGSTKTIVDKLSGGQMQGVAIARVITFDAKIVVMDEPTANLSVKIIPLLLSLMKKLKARGISIIFITHRLQDIVSVCERIMVLRQGICVGESPTAETSLNEITALITGEQTSFRSSQIRAYGC